jgi:hypothetical protein
MKKQTQHLPQQIRFRRWSRASYAVFISLSVTVTIGFLSVSVGEKSLLKAENQNLVAQLTAFSLNEELEQDECIAELNDCFFKELNTVTSLSDNAAARRILLNITNQPVDRENTSVNRFFIL